MNKLAAIDFATRLGVLVATTTKQALDGPAPPSPTSAIKPPQALPPAPSLGNKVIRTPSSDNWNSTSVLSTAPSPLPSSRVPSYSRREAAPVAPATPAVSPERPQLPSVSGQQPAPALGPATIPPAKPQPPPPPSASAPKPQPLSPAPKSVDLGGPLPEIEQRPQQQVQQPSQRLLKQRQAEEIQRQWLQRLQQEQQQTPSAGYNTPALQRRNMQQQRRR